MARVDAVVSWKDPQCAGNMTKKKPAATFKVEHLCCVESHPHIPVMLGEHIFHITCHEKKTTDPTGPFTLQ